MMNVSNFWLNHSSQFKEKKNGKNIFIQFSEYGKYCHKHARRRLVSETVYTPISN